MAIIWMEPLSGITTEGRDLLHDVGSPHALRIDLFDGDVLASEAARTATALRRLGDRWAGAASPPARIFIVAHSMGGIAALEALRSLAETGDAPLVRVEAVLLLSVPLRRP